MSTFSPSSDSLVGFPELLRRLRFYLEQSGLTCSKYIIDHSGNTAAHLVNDTFSIDMQTANTGEYRDVTPARIEHTVGINIVWKMMPVNDQFEALAKELAAEEPLLRSVLVQATTAEVRVTYVSTARNLSPAREYLLVRHTFRVVHDWYGEPME
jgi:hypothetical protein